MIFNTAFPEPNPLRDAIRKTYRQDETECINTLLQSIAFSPDALQRIRARANALVAQTREYRKKQAGIDAFLHEYDLSSQEGILLMCLAEALLRTPDNVTRDRLIKDKISRAQWKIHLSSNRSLFVKGA